MPIRSQIQVFVATCCDSNFFCYFELSTIDVCVCVGGGGDSLQFGTSRSRVEMLI